MSLGAGKPARGSWRQRHRVTALMPSFARSLGPGMESTSTGMIGVPFQPVKVPPTNESSRSCRHIQQREGDRSVESLDVEAPGWWVPLSRQHLAQRASLARRARREDRLRVFDHDLEIPTAGVLDINMPVELAQHLSHPMESSGLYRFICGFMGFLRIVNSGGDFRTKAPPIFLGHRHASPPITRLRAAFFRSRTGWTC